jgi:hypothetical protein
MVRQGGAPWLAAGVLDADDANDAAASRMGSLAT